MLPLEILKPLGLIRPPAAVLAPPAVEDLFRHAKLPNHLRNSLTPGHLNVGFPELADDLLGLRLCSHGVCYPLLACTIRDSLSESGDVEGRQVMAKCHGPTYRLANSYFRPLFRVIVYEPHSRYRRVLCDISNCNCFGRSVTMCIRSTGG